jgi:hypothetical protein
MLPFIAKDHIFSQTGPCSSLSVPYTSNPARSKLVPRLINKWAPWFSAQERDEKYKRLLSVMRQFIWIWIYSQINRIFYRCKAPGRFLRDLPETSVIICFHNEAWSGM